MGKPSTLSQQGGSRQPQDGPKMAPRWPKDGSRWLPRLLKMVQDDSRQLKTAQDGPEMAPRWLKMAPKMAQDGPRWLKIAPRCKIAS